MAHGHGFETFHPLDFAWPNVSLLPRRLGLGFKPRAPRDPAVRGQEYPKLPPPRTPALVQATDAFSFCGGRPPPHARGVESVMFFGRDLSFRDIELVRGIRFFFFKAFCRWPVCESVHGLRGVRPCASGGNACMPTKGVYVAPDSRVKQSVG